MICEFSMPVASRFPSGEKIIPVTAAVHGEVELSECFFPVPVSNKRMGLLFGRSRGERNLAVQQPALSRRVRKSEATRTPPAHRSGIALCPRPFPQP